MLRRTVSCAGHPLPVWCSVPRHLQNILPTSHSSDKALAIGTNTNNLDREVKRHGHFEQRPAFFRRVFKSWQRVFVRYNIDYLLCIHHHLDVARQLHQEMAILDEYLVSSKAQMGNTPKFPSLLSPSLILKGF